MCQQIIQFCSGSTKALLLAGGLLSLLLAVAIGYTGCSANALYTDIDADIAGTRSLAYLLQLAAAGYLTLITLFSCYAAYYDQKHSIRALAFISTLNFVLALVAIMMVPSGSELGQLFEGTLKQAAAKYNFTDKGPMQQKPVSAPREPQNLSMLPVAAGMMAIHEPNPTGTVKKRRWTDASIGETVRQLTPANATKIWDQLQSRGCCGLVNATEWRPHLPKSCCNSPVLEGDEKFCKTIDLDHQMGCLALIGSTSLNLLIVLALIALVNFYLALISGISAYRTFHYDEAAQSAYT